jgi:hypothetical protein
MKVSRKEGIYGLLKAAFCLASQIYALYLIFFKKSSDGVLWAAITFGDTASPSQISIYFDSVFSQSLPSFKNQLTDNIGATNAFLHQVLKSDYYEGDEGGTHWQETLMYALSPMESYDGYDELSTTTTDGITDAVYQWSQLATPVSYSMKELIQNKRKILSLVNTKMTQMQMGIQEGFATHFMQGSGNGALETAKVNPVNGSSSINPLPLLVKFDPTTTSLGNIDPATYTWWRNKTKTSSLSGSSKPSDFINEWQNIFNSTALGTGGPPDICLADQVTYELAAISLYQQYRNTQGDPNFPFTNLRLPFGNGKSLLVLDDKVPDVYSGTTATTTYGTMYMLNSKFFRLKYIEGRDFEMLEDENGKTFVKPVNQDARIGHTAWMGQSGVNNRRKHGVWAKIPRSLTYAN